MVSTQFAKNNCVELFAVSVLRELLSVLGGGVTVNIWIVSLRRWLFRNIIPIKDIQNKQYSESSFPTLYSELRKSSYH